MSRCERERGRDERACAVQATAVVSLSAPHCPLPDCREKKRQAALEAHQQQLQQALQESSNEHARAIAADRARLKLIEVRTSDERVVTAKFEQTLRELDSKYQAQTVETHGHTVRSVPSAPLLAHAYAPCA